MFLVIAMVGLILLFCTLLSDRCHFKVSKNGGLTSMGIAAFVVFFGCAGVVLSQAGHPLVLVLLGGLGVGVLGSIVFSSAGAMLLTDVEPDDDDDDLEATA